MKIDTLVSNYEELIRDLTSDSSNRRRFVEIEGLAKQANDLLRLGGESSVLDFNSTEGNTGFELQPIRGAMGETGEVVRALMATFEPMMQDQQRRARAEAQSAGAKSLLDLVRARKALVTQNLATDEVDAQIEQARKEIGDAVVPTLFLRGHSIRTTGNEVDKSDVDQADGTGAASNGGSASNRA